MTSQWHFNNLIRCGPTTQAKIFKINQSGRFDISIHPSDVTISISVFLYFTSGTRTKFNLGRIQIGDYYHLFVRKKMKRNVATVRKDYWFFACCVWGKRRGKPPFSKFALTLKCHLPGRCCAYVAYIKRNLNRPYNTFVLL